MQTLKTSAEMENNSSDTDFSCFGKVVIFNLHEHNWFVILKEFNKLFLV